MLTDVRPTNAARPIEVSISALKEVLRSVELDTWALTVMVRRGTQDACPVISMLAAADFQFAAGSILVEDGNLGEQFVDQTGDSKQMLALAADPGRFMPEMATDGGWIACGQSFPYLTLSAWIIFGVL